jgi:hypothetical protein
VVSEKKAEKKNKEKGDDIPQERTRVVALDVVVGTVSLGLVRKALWEGG